MIHNIRTATLSDLEAIATLVNSAYRGDYSRQGWTTEADLLGGQRTDPEMLEEMLSASGNSMELLFDQNHKLIGSVLLVDESPATLYFGMLTVEPTLQGKGVGKILLRHVEAVAGRKKKQTLRMTVIDLRKELIAFYERQGFTFTGRTEAFPENDPKFGIPHQKLVLLIYEKILISENA